MSHTDTSGCPPHELHAQVEFSTGQPKEGSPETEFRQEPDAAFFRKFFNDKLTFPDGFEAEIWGFEDETSGRGLPSPPIRAHEDDIVHVELKPAKGPHTIHMHGIEPDPRNDGAGHTSFEVTGSYTYQFRAQPGLPGDPGSGTAGTYFYHCHVNTVLHVQMGMFGPLIIDPPQGRGMAFADDPVGYDPRAETLIVPFAVDPRWHDLSHAAGLDGEDVGLNRFEPSHFYLLGADLNKPWPSTPVKTVGRIAATAAPDLPALLRVNNATYFPTNIRFHGGLKAEVISHDGRPLRDTSVTPSPPVDVLTDIVGFGAAERYDMRLRPPADAKPGDTFGISVEWVHWVTNEVIHTETREVVVLDPDTAGGRTTPGGGAVEGAPAPGATASETPAPGAPAAPATPGAPVTPAGPAKPGPSAGSRARVTRPAKRKRRLAPKPRTKPARPARNSPRSRLRRPRRKR